MRLPRDLSGEAVCSALQRLGFTVSRQVGSHIRLSKENRHVTVPRHRNITIGTLKSILRQADVSAEDFLSRL